ncbi:MAG: hypothetical protein AUK47_06695 [Deltaproteobacteria bacterium CG2_30_63_29]|nr:MAG: hypothetical protein AUK47_06695 [Deltaproteobacteria bacterium CG2_30_63_29]PIV99056.1 MAG: hypothetical protein COW42_12285 [Deltaproteobacteria bacterium CG17_big_fil_post_rev_8_21_14_2_50_63_7]PJB45062.1 MAG: hypothetical protein CO108_07910 [Deltaproteobacteria bacterium CG_4_9_14_3_um_filter_63_12]
MIHFECSPKPSEFEEQVEKPGAAWLTKHATERPKDLWGVFKPALANAFRNLCAYSAMFEPVGTVDHFVSCDEDRSKAYVWSNYRFASGWINSSKSTVTSSEIFDPFEVGDGWFEILLPSLQLVATHAVPETLRKRADFVLDRLHLRDDERVIRQRREWYRMYQEHELTLDGLRKKAPLIALAVEKQQRSAA